MHPPQINYTGVNHYSINFNGQTFYYSYTTLVAYSGPHGRARLSAQSRTTGKHMSNMGVTDFAFMLGDVFDRFVSDALDETLED